MKRETEALRRLRLEHDARTLDGDLRAFPVEIMTELQAVELVQRGAIPAFLNQEVMGCRERLQPRAELLDEAIDASGPPRGLPRHGLDHRQQVFRTVRELPHQQAQMGFTL